MSQQSSSFSHKEGSPLNVHDIATSANATNPNEVLNVAPLRVVHVKETAHSTCTETKGGYHEITRISVPLNSVMPNPPQDSSVNQNGSSQKETKDVPMAEVDQKIDEDVPEDDGNVSDHVPDNVPNNVKETAAEGCDVDDGNVGGDTGAYGTCATIMEVDNMSDDELIALVIPIIAKRLMTRRKGKAVMHYSPKKKTDVNSPVNKKDEVGSPIKKKVVAKSTIIGPTKYWSKVVPKKRKAIVLNETNSDVPSDVPDISRRKKPSSSKLATSVPDVEVYVPKRLALERELAKNVLECKEVMELIHHVGFMKTVSNFSKCYENLVKEFIVNLSRDYADGKSKEFRKVFVRGKCVIFSSYVINNYLERLDEAQPELDVTIIKCVR
ncbi:uncharacterized protein LOC131598575 [Vicia villosa]|uniref:uncharacterized protein LOC131598575 n=1 Tax=Vicia villosa TaxID=3911 RepID=UPI00273AFF5D|nr:uncharacterized protein LOC131598575 [Vicia villosa]